MTESTAKTKNKNIQKKREEIHNLCPNYLDTMTFLAVQISGDARFVTCFCGENKLIRTIEYTSHQQYFTKSGKLPVKTIHISVAALVGI